MPLAEDMLFLGHGGVGCVSGIMLNYSTSTTGMKGNLHSVHCPHLEHTSILNDEAPNVQPHHGLVYAT